MPVNRVFCLIVLFALLCSCTRARDGYKFIFASELDGRWTDGYEFEADLFDTTALYSTFIAARIDPSRIVGETVPMEILVMSPLGDIAAERFDFPLSSCGAMVESDYCAGRCVDVEWPYRDNVKVGRSTSAPGVWKVRITPLPVGNPAVLGIGFRYQNSNGKR